MIAREAPPLCDDKAPAALLPGASAPRALGSPSHCLRGPVRPCAPLSPCACSRRSPRPLSIVRAENRSRISAFLAKWQEQTTLLFFFFLAECGRARGHTKSLGGWDECVARILRGPGRVLACVPAPSRGGRQNSTTPVETAARWAVLGDSAWKSGLAGGLCDFGR